MNYTQKHIKQAQKYADSFKADILSGNIQINQLDKKGRPS
jgi:hypothetical protein